MLVAGAAAKVKWQRWLGGDPNFKSHRTKKTVDFLART
jgi:hypothetical protein